MSGPQPMEGRGAILLPKKSLPEEQPYTEVGLYTRSHFFTPMELLKPVVGRPAALMQANIRHRSQIAPYIESLLNSRAESLILAISEGVQRSFGICVEEAAYFAARLIDEYNMSSPSGHGQGKKIAFLFDHVLTYEAAERALQAGVSGIMYDPSHSGRRIISIEENIAYSRRFVDLAEKYEASVELEVGVVPGMDGALKSEFSEPSAVAFLVKAYPDVAVAVSVGNEHYKLSPKGRGLQLSLFSRIRKVVPNTPLVLHGGTGVSDSDLKASITSLLLDKLNVGTEFMKAILLSVANALLMGDLSGPELRSPTIYRNLLFYVDAYPQRYLEAAQKAVYRSALAKLDFLSRVKKSL